MSPTRLQETLSALDACARRAATTEGLTLGEAVDDLGGSSFCFVCVLAASPFLQPISLGPFTMASGGVLMLIGWQMAQGGGRLSLPAKVRSFILRGSLWVTVLSFCRRLLRLLSRFTKPRWSGWVDGGQGSKNTGWLIFLGGALLALPCANLPFNNTLPALMALFAAVGWLERDGAMALVSIAWGILTLAYFAVVGWLVFWFGARAFAWLGGG